MQDEPTLPQPTPLQAATPLQPALREAERVLRESLGEVCATDPARADTGEMIRLDEMLAIAGDAAKRAVSLRRRLRQQKPSGSASASASASAAAPATTDGATTGAAPAGSGAGQPSRATRPRGRLSRAGEETRTAVEGAAIRAGEADHRTFRDAKGVTWSVWAVYPQATSRSKAGLRGDYANGWLTFVCETEKRRLSPVPEGWSQLDDGALEALCCSAETARPETPTRRMRAIE